MAKTRGKAPSIHSRAARRATSPSINTDKSLKDVKPPPESADARPSVLGLQKNAGVTKKSKRGRKAVMSTRARKRHERGLEKAEAVVDRTSVKVQKSRKAAAIIASRKKGWDDINGQAVGTVAGVNKFAGLANDDDDDAEEVDEEMWEAEQSMPAAAPAAAAVVVPAEAPPPQDDDGEIL